MATFTQEEKKLIEFAKKRYPKILKKRRAKGLYDTYHACVLSNSGKIYESIPFISKIATGHICCERVAIANMCFNETEKAKIKSILGLGSIGKGGNLTRVVYVARLFMSFQMEKQLFYARELILNAARLILTFYSKS